MDDNQLTIVKEYEFDKPLIHKKESELIIVLEIDIMNISIQMIIYVFMILILQLLFVTK